jgi:hypothetical protein
MTFKEAMKLAKDNPGHGIRAIDMTPGWKVVYFRIGKSGGFFAINPVTGTDYAFAPTELSKKANWVHATCQ